MSQDFQEVCPEVHISLDQHLVEYTVKLNHTVRENQMQIAGKDGDLVSETREGGSIKGDVKQACEVIIADWARK